MKLRMKLLLYESFSEDSAGLLLRGLPLPRYLRLAVRDWAMMRSPNRLRADQRRSDVRHPSGRTPFISHSSVYKTAGQPERRNGRQTYEVGCGRRALLLWCPKRHAVQTQAVAPTAKAGRHSNKRPKKQTIVIYECSLHTDKMILKDRKHTTGKLL